MNTIHLEVRELERNGKTKAVVDVYTGKQRRFTDGVTADSALSRERFSRKAAKTIGKNATAEEQDKIASDIDLQLVGIMDMPADKPSSTNQKNTSSRDRYVLVPGAHTTETGRYIEVGTHDFSASVIASCKSGSLYRRGKVPGRVVGESGSKEFVALTNDSMRLQIDSMVKLASWRRSGKASAAEYVQVYQSCSRDLAGVVLAAAAVDPRVPQVRTLTPYPVFDTNFELSRPGYHNGIFYDQPDDLRDLKAITDADVIRETFEDITCDFPWKCDADRQNYYGLLMTPMLVYAVNGNRPIHGILSPLERVGKTQLAEAPGVIYQNRSTPAQQLPRNEEEADKRIMSMLLRGDSLLNFDNLKEYTDCAPLAALVTSNPYQGRNLGILGMLDLPNFVTVMTTGNNPQTTGEIAKRVVPICLQPNTDCPESRTDFRHPDFHGYIRANRQKILGCIVGAVEIWKNADRPEGKSPMGGFDKWAKTIGGIMALLGFDEWLSNAQEWRDAADPRKGDLRAMVQHWHNVHTTSPVTVTELLMIAQQNDLFPAIIGNQTSDKGMSTSFGMRVLSRNLNMPVTIKIGSVETTFFIRRYGDSRPTKYHLELVKS